MYRFLLSLSALAVFIASPQSWGLGLGEIELDSALNQKFSATIELFDTSGLEPGEIIVSLGSSDDFKRVGVERFFLLTDLQFDVTYGPTGKARIQVSSSRAVTEPYLNFLVEVLWPSGRMLKEYTVLLDPPTFREAAAPAVMAPRQGRDSATSSGRVRRVEPANTGTQAQSGTQVQIAPRTQTEPSALDQGLSGEEYGMTDRDDTLWSIALRVRRANGASIQQTMLAIQELNPEAFINGNINLLKAGYVLRLPDEKQARALSNSEALAAVARHEEAWRAYNRGDRTRSVSKDTSVAGAGGDTSELRSPVDATAASESAAPQTVTEGELRIVAEAGDSTTGVGGADLDAAREEADRLSRQVDELTYQLDREKELAINELSIRDRQLEVKDQQIVQLQSQLAAAQQASAQQQTAAAEAPQNQNQSTSVQPEIPWWQSPMVLYGGAGALVLLLVGGMVTVRKRRALEEDDYYDSDEAFASDARLEPEVGEADAATIVDDSETDDSDQDTDENTRIAPVLAHDAEEELEGSQTSDVIGEADIYIAYGRFPQAIGLLLGVLEDEPERNDARLKLLEVYSETGDRGSFDEHMTALVEYCDSEEALLAARELEDRFGESAISLDEMIAEEAEETEEEVSADAETVVESDLGEESVSAAEDSTASVEEMEFELELDDMDDVAEPNGADLESASEADPGDELGGDLGIDFNPEEDSAAEDDVDSGDNGIEFEAVTIGETEHAEEDFADAEEDFADAEEDFAEAKEDFGEAEESDLDEDGAKTEELTIDAELEEAAANFDNFSSFDADAEDGSTSEAALAESDVAVESDVEAESLDDLQFETVTSADDEFEFQDEGDSANTKLDLARAYIDMGDTDGARDILKEVQDEGNSDQQQKAQAMLDSL